MLWVRNKRKQNYAQTFTARTNTVVSLALQQSNKNPTLGKLALTTVLRRKGRVMDAMTDTVQTLQAQLADNPDTKKLFDEWLNIQQQLANLVYRGAGEQKFGNYQQQIKKLEAEKEELENRVSAKSAEFRKEIKICGIDRYPSSNSPRCGNGGDCSVQSI
ncbi:MAG: hypothetical protein HC787_04860 [Nostocaceae cyanobacterium CSU_2_110]|nr:hypothetical protein [Nostocaceae cyanobacterium CSU_2_110]